MRKLVTLLVAVGTAIGLMVVAAPAASANTFAYVCVGTCTSNSAHAWFITDGDNFEVCDDKVDGYSAVLQGYRPDGTYFERWMNGGGNTCGMFYFNFGEHLTFRFRVSLGVSSNGAMAAFGAWVWANTSA